MRFGLYLNSQYPQEDDPRQRFHDLVEQVRLAASLGYDSIWAGEHHVPAPFQYFSQFPLLARLSADAGGMQVGTNLVLLPLHQPVDIAERGAALDVMTDGRFVLGVGLGFRPAEFDAFGVALPQRVGRMVEAIEIIDRLWTQDQVSFSGDHFTLDGVGIRPRPIQHPRPPIWVGATVDAAVERAARIGDAWLMTSLPTMSDLVLQVERYRKALEVAGRDFPAEFPRMLEVHCAADGDAARERAAEPLTTKYETYADWGQRDLMPDRSGLDQAFADLAADRFVIGDPATVIDGLRRQRTELGITHVAMRMQWPGMSQADALDSIERVGRDVMPVLRAEEAGS